MESRGGETGGLTILEALALYEAEGYRGQFGARNGGEVRCFTCGAQRSASEYGLEHESRIEGVSDPADETMVAAMRCPVCGARGTATFAYGARAPPEEAEAMKLLLDRRHDHPTGWRNKPDDLPMFDSD